MKNIQQVLGEEADSLARQTGFVKRQRKISGSIPARILVAGVPDNPLPSHTDLSHDATLLGVSITSQGLEQRFTPGAAQLMQKILIGCNWRALRQAQAGSSGGKDWLKSRLQPLTDRIYAVEVE